MCTECGTSPRDGSHPCPDITHLERVDLWQDTMEAIRVSHVPRVLDTRTSINKDIEITLNYIPSYIDCTNSQIP